MLRSLALAALFLPGGSPLFAQPPMAGRPELEWAKIDRETVEMLSEYIRIDTSNPPGNEIRGVQWFQKIFDAEGIPYQTGESAPGRGNIAARLKGTGGEPALILLSHIDVVPASRGFWSVNPFAGTIRDGYLWGRGSIDMKSKAIAELVAFLTLRRQHVPLRRDVIFVATADEEAGGSYGAGWVVKNRPEWIEGAGFLLTEGSVSRADESGKVIYFGISTTGKSPGWLRLIATGPAGHGSIPLKNSAVNRLVAALERLRNYRPPLEVTPAVEHALRTQAPYEPEPWNKRYADIRSFIKQPGAYEELEKRPGLLALLTNTLAITRLEGSNKINVIPPVATAELDCRLLPDSTIDRWREQVRKIIQDDSIRIEVVLNFPATVSPAGTPLSAAIEDAVKKRHPIAGFVQTVEPFFTDSHFFRDRGITSYGFVPYAITEADENRQHGNDERIPLAAFTDGVRLLWEVVYNFSRAQ